MPHKFWFSCIHIIYIHLSTPDSRHFLHGAQTRTRNKAPWRAQVDAAMPLCLLAMSADNDPHHADFFHCTSRYKRIHRIHEYPFITESISSCMRFRLAVPKMAPWQLEWVASRIRSTFEILQMLFILQCIVICTVCKVVVNLHSILWRWISLWI